MLWRSNPDVSWVDPSLAIGGRLSRAIDRYANELGIRRIVDLRIEDKDDEEQLRLYGIELLHLPTDDMCAVAQPMLDDGVTWVNDQIARGERVLVHCEHGVGRSALLLTCVLVSRGDTPREALVRAKRARSRVCPSPDQLEALLTWSSRHRAARGAL